MFRVEFADGCIVEDPDIKNIIRASFHDCYYGWVYHVSGFDNVLRIKKWTGERWIYTPYKLHFSETAYKAHASVAEFTINDLVVRTIVITD